MLYLSSHEESTEGVEVQLHLFMPRSLCRHGKNIRYPLNRRLGWPQSRSRRFGEDNFSRPCPKFSSATLEEKSPTVTDDDSPVTWNTSATVSLITLHSHSQIVAAREQQLVSSCHTFSLHFHFLHLTIQRHLSMSTAMHPYLLALAKLYLYTLHTTTAAAFIRPTFSQNRLHWNKNFSYMYSHGRTNNYAYMSH